MTKTYTAVEQLDSKIELWNDVHWTYLSARKLENHLY